MSLPRQYQYIFSIIILYALSIIINTVWSMFSIHLGIKQGRLRFFKTLQAEMIINK